MGYLNGIEVSAVGSKGGLCIGWKKGIMVELRSFYVNYIDVMVTNSNDNLKWRLMGFYGEPNSRRRVDSWNY